MHRTDVDYYESEPEIKNCPEGHTCSWFEEDLTAGNCIQNCGFEVPVNWSATDIPSCPAGYSLVADESEAVAGKPAAHCVAIEETAK